MAEAELILFFVLSSAKRGTRGEDYRLSRNENMSSTV